MKFETLKKDNKKKITIGIIAIISIISVLIFAGSFAKYKLTQSIPLTNGTINYTVPALNMIAIYQEKESGGYDKVNTIPTSGYTFSNESYCAILKGNSFEKKEDITVNYNMDTKTISVAPITEKTRCYLYFDKKILSGSEYILGGITANPGSDSFTDVAITDEGVFTAEDDDGTTYYYRGAVVNNYLKFANKWWRIIRINGDGTIRIIYDGTAYHANGESSYDKKIESSKFNISHTDNAYVGFMYGATGQTTYEATHANINKSTIMKKLETWYTNNLVSYENKIDIHAGFCGDRSINKESTTWWSSDTKKGYGTNATAYGLFDKIYTESAKIKPHTPTFSCLNSNDLYTVKRASKGNKALDYPIGLITADEVIYAGGFYGKQNASYYLYSGNEYWTMTPERYTTDKYAFVAAVEDNGWLTTFYVDMYRSGYGDIRPVINLRADVELTGSGTGEDPFVVVGAE